MKKIIMMHGLPGTGKSYIADKIATHFPKTTVLKTVRFREGLERPSPERFDETNPTTRKEKDATYKQLCKAAKKTLQEGKIPIPLCVFHSKDPSDRGNSLSCPVVPLGLQNFLS